MLNLLDWVIDGSHLSLPCVEDHRARSLVIETMGVDGINLDGELKGTMSMAAEMTPNAMRVLVHRMRARCAHDR